MPSKKSKRVKSWSMFPSLHADVSQKLKQDNLDFQFHNVDDGDTCIEEYDTNIMGRFFCRNPKCDSSGWSSKMIAITIRMYEGAAYNARVYHQRCKACNRLSHPRLDVESYTDRISYRLKKWKGIAMETPYYSGESNGPHHSRLCEGCKNGHCSQAGTF